MAGPKTDEAFCEGNGQVHWLIYTPSKFNLNGYPKNGGFGKGEAFLTYGYVCAYPYSNFWEQYF